MSRISATPPAIPQEALPSVGGGRRSTGYYGSLEKFAERHPKPQAKIERGRLRAGKAKHRAHRELLRGAA
ncbi:hypothetical protein [Acaricomes phytoseiuli]|uniref:hypothetical protein n=1 Tax=Acaricomes phytoseiuli TaxID=291968 RepID=UPI0012EA9D0B|nr:hypothetical protein [Acaricomes phytoseiuli]